MDRFSFAPSDVSSRALFSPDIVLVLVTGLLLARIAWPLTTRWVQEALALWAVGAAILACDLVVLRQQEQLLEARGPGSVSYRRVSLLGRGLGAGLGLVVVAILYLMVFKPGT